MLLRQGGGVVVVPSCRLGNPYMGQSEHADGGWRTTTWLLRSRPHRRYHRQRPQRLRHALGVKVDCETLVIDKGIMETVPVTSGESGQEGKISICVCTEQKGFAPPTNCATEMFHLSPICKGVVDEISWASKRRHRKETHNGCVEVGPLWYSRASRDRVREAGVEGLA